MATVGASLVSFSFGPPLELSGAPAVSVRSFDDAIGVLRDYVGSRPRIRDLILRRLNTASTEHEAGEAAKSFRWWAEQEGLLLPPK
jgi:hypothetical protein